jgi:hypothetical protein
LSAKIKFVGENFIVSLRTNEMNSRNGMAMKISGCLMAGSLFNFHDMTGFVCATITNLQRSSLKLKLNGVVVAKDNEK